jgi:hypothetical protein
MKLGLITSGFAAVLVATVCGCSSAVPARASLVATTELHSATLSDASAAPKVGKSYLAASDDDDATVDTASAKNALAAPKDDRPSDCSRRAGHFGSAK